MPFNKIESHNQIIFHLFKDNIINYMTLNQMKIWNKIVFRFCRDDITTMENYSQE